MVNSKKFYFAGKKDNTEDNNICYFEGVSVLQKYHPGSGFTITDGAAAGVVFIIEASS